ncbi:MFS transporter [Anatilimnocola sp. NA78]|uniref:MFS transporter n=1 Tax=Anatilimnocola sp. NA78 TaxID=3415683 RepID=UPI003CE52141
MERLTSGTEEGPARPANWKWFICSLLFLATMLMYMDRLTLSQMASRITRELSLTNEHYGRMEMGFGLAFALGAIVNGLLADRFSIRWLYPVMLVGWSLAGVATAWSVEIGQVLLPMVGQNAWLGTKGNPSDAAFIGMFACRVVLGFFESGHWPCALITTQRLLSGADRTLGNSLLQSGASVGAVITPLVILLMISDEEGSWRRPFIIIGLAGMSWVIPWLLMVRDRDLKYREPVVDPASAPVSIWTRALFKKAVVLLAIVITINMTWQFFRAWMPKLMQEEHGYGEVFTSFFMSGFYLVADLGCLAAGGLVKGLTGAKMSLNVARISVFAVFTQFVLMSAVAAQVPASPLLLGLFLVVGFGALGLFPVYYSLSQEIATKRFGFVTGLFGATTWIITSYMQFLVGRNVDQTHSYQAGLFWIGMVPLIGCLALALLWPEEEPTT